MAKLVGATFKINDRVMKDQPNGSSKRNPSFGVRYGNVTSHLIRTNMAGARHHYYQVRWDGDKPGTYRSGEHAQHVLAHVPPDSPHYQPIL